jgi:hypothetical protein
VTRNPPPEGGLGTRIHKKEKEKRRLEMFQPPFELAS